MSGFDTRRSRAASGAGERILTYRVRRGKKGFHPESTLACWHPSEFSDHVLASEICFEHNYF
jgi:hypothetical protein